MVRVMILMRMEKRLGEDAEMGDSEPMCVFVRRDTKRSWGLG